MRQLTLRVPEQLAERLKQAAAEQERSVNSLATAVLTAAVDPELAGDEASRVRERLARAGLLGTGSSAPRRRPDEAEVKRARKRAGRGRSLSELVSEGRR
jgi:plasmid stability protein